MQSLNPPALPSFTQLVDIRVASPTVIEATWRLGGYLKFPWHPRVEAFTGAWLWDERACLALCAAAVEAARRRRHTHHLSPCLPPAGHSTYTLNEQGLVAVQDQTWEISGLAALVETFTPTVGVRGDIKAALSA